MQRAGISCQRKDESGGDMINHSLFRLKLDHVVEFVKDGTMLAEA